MGHSLLKLVDFGFAVARFPFRLPSAGRFVDVVFLASSPSLLPESLPADSFGDWVRTCPVDDGEGLRVLGLASGASSRVVASARRSAELFSETAPVTRAFFDSPAWTGDLVTFLRWRTLFAYRSF